MEWIVERMKLPKEIVEFIVSVFEIYEIRGRVGEQRGIIFEVRSREPSNHIPHLHASYGEHNISIALDSIRVLDGNLPPKQQKIALKWVEENITSIQNEWNRMHVNSESRQTSSGLDMH